MPIFHNVGLPEPELGDLTVGIHQPFEVVPTVVRLDPQLVTKLGFGNAYKHTQPIPYQCPRNWERKTDDVTVFPEMQCQYRMSSGEVPFVWISQVN